MKIVVTSHNPVKIEAVRQAFKSQFPEHKVELVPLGVDSGVGSAAPIAIVTPRNKIRRRLRINAKRFSIFM